jgi:hypothetical protein
MASLGPAAKITTRAVNDLLAKISATGVKPRTVNKYRPVMLAVYNHGCEAIARAVADLVFCLVGISSFGQMFLFLNLPCKLRLAV